jgi:hypothetical protein
MYANVFQWVRPHIDPSSCIPQNYHLQFSVLSGFIQAISSVGVHSSEFVPLANIIFSVSCSLQLVSKKMLVYCSLVSISRLVLTSTSRLTLLKDPTRFPVTRYCLELSHLQTGPRYIGCRSCHRLFEFPGTVTHLQQVPFVSTHCRPDGFSSQFWTTSRPGSPWTLSRWLSFRASRFTRTILRTTSFSIHRMWYPR